MDLLTIGTRIDHALKTSDVSIAQAATQCDVSQQAVYSWIRDEIKNLRNDHLFALAELTGFEAKWISTGRGPKRLIYRENPKAALVLKVMESILEFLQDKLVEDAKSLKDIADRIERDGTNG